MPSKLFSILMLLLLTTSTLQAQTAKPDSVDVIDKILMERITVVGNPAWMTGIPGAASYIGYTELQKQNYSDINRILRGISGVNIQEEDGFGLRPNIGLRGAGVERSTKVNLMEDGVLIAPAPYSAPAAYYFPNVSRMSSVEVRKGSSQIKYGPNTTGGAINMISTRIPYELKTRAELSAGEFNSSKLHANIGSSYNNFGFLLEGLQIQNDGFKQLDNNGNTGFDVREFMGKFMVKTSPDAATHQRLELKVGYHDQVSDETYLGLTRDDFQINPLRRYAGSQQDRITAEHLSFVLRHFIQFSENLDITTTAYRNDFARNWYKLQTAGGSGLNGLLQNPDSNPLAMSYLRGSTSQDNALRVRANNREYLSQGIQSTVAFNLSTGSLGHSLEAGVRFHQDEEDRFQWEDGYRMQDGTMILTNPGTPGTQANRIGTATALSFYLQDQITLNRFTFTPGFRYENIRFTDQNFGGADLNREGANLSENEYTVSVFVPGIGATFTLNDEITFLAGIHKGFSPPSPGSDADTRSEESINLEAGARFANNWLNAEVIGFFNKYDNLLGSDLAAGGGGGTSAQFNAGKVDVKGIEFALNAELSNVLKTSFGIPFSINYTFTDAIFGTTFNSSFGPWGTVEKGDEIPFIPRHQMNISTGVSFTKLDVNLNANTTSQMRTVAGSGDIDQQYSTDRYFLLDLSGSYKITGSLTAFMNIRNLLDQTYIVSDRPAGVRPGLPRMAMGGIRFEI